MVCHTFFKMRNCSLQLNECVWWIFITSQRKCNVFKHTRVLLNPHKWAFRNKGQSISFFHLFNLPSCKNLGGMYMYAKHVACVWRGPDRICPKTLNWKAAPNFRNVDIWPEFIGWQKLSLDLTLIPSNNVWRISKMRIILKFETYIFFSSMRLIRLLVESSTFLTLFVVKPLAGVATCSVVGH